MASATGGEQGKSGLLVAHGGYVEEELHPNLSGRKALETYRSMKDNDALVGALLFAIDMLLRQVEWSVEEQDAKQEHAEFLESCMDDMSHSWADFISEALSMLPFGFAFHEIVYKQRKGPQPEGSKIPSSKFSDGKVGVRKIALRAQETLDHWEFDEDGGIKAFVQRSAPDYQEIPIPMVKGLLFRTTTYKNNPEGRSIFRSAYRSWYFKTQLERIEGTGIERDLAGFPVIWMPAEYLVDNATPEQKAVVQAFVDIGTRIKRDKQEFLMMPLQYDEAGNKMFDFELMTSGGSRSFDVPATIQRYNQGIAMSVLGDFILLGHEKVGSFALSSDKTDLFAVALGTFLDVIEEVINRFLVPRLFALNGFPLDNLPRIKHGDIEKPDLAALGAFITALHGAGVPLFPDDDLEAYLREAAGLPEVSEDTKQAREERAAQVEEQMSRGQDGGDGTAEGSRGGQAGPREDSGGTGRRREDGAAGPAGRGGRGGGSGSGTGGNAGAGADA